jgi:hypothetical protein
MKIAKVKLVNKEWINSKYKNDEKEYRRDFLGAAQVESGSQRREAQPPPTRNADCVVGYRYGRASLP